MDIHSSGDHLIVGGYDRKLCWFDLDLSDKPHKVLRYISPHMVPDFILIKTFLDTINAQLGAYTSIRSTHYLLPVPMMGRCRYSTEGCTTTC
jgi:hypothetical protein